MKTIPVEARGAHLQMIDLKYYTLPVERALGVEWCVESDTFQFRVTLNNKHVTSRGILSTVSSIFDPLGLVSPFLLLGKQILQSICKDGKNWDDPLGDETTADCVRWKSDLLNLVKIKIPRNHVPVSF